ncbi:MAG TPA: MoxR family ATPase [Acidimicrobiales bacterium]|nr:MoxR family ATPase [Acidimicrobiales bacterium]
MSLLDETGSIPAERRNSREAVAALFDSIVGAVSDVVLVERRVVELAVVAIVAEGHLLIEDHPGLGKTTTVKALAAATGLELRRVQCTADLLPADVTGALVLDPSAREPVFRPGPIFANIVLADELNRASPRAQSAFLEAMGEGQVTVDGATYQLPRPFMVVATQNPFDDAGTTHIPQSQRDRFLLRLSLGYPNREREHQLLVHGDRAPLVGEVPSIGTAGLASLQAAVSRTHVAPALADYVLELLEATRRHESVGVGASPRAGLAVMRAARALAVGRGRDYVSPDDVQAVVGPALAHRLVLSPEAALYGADPIDVVDDVLKAVPVVVGHPGRQAD